ARPGTARAAYRSAEAGRRCSGGRSIGAQRAAGGHRGGSIRRATTASSTTAAVAVLRTAGLRATARVDLHPQRAASHVVLADVGDVRRPAILYLKQAVLSAAISPVQLS